MVRASDLQSSSCGFDSRLVQAIGLPRSTQPSIPPWLVNRVPACLAGLGRARSLVSGSR